MLRAAILALAALLLAGCVTETRPRSERVPSPWPEDGAPSALLLLSEDLQAYHATIGRMPDELADLDRAGYSTGGPYAKHAYAWHQAGLGVLKEGWRVQVADDRVREAGQVWCIVRPPPSVRGVGGLRVVRVPMPELRDAAATAGAGQ